MLTDTRTHIVITDAHQSDGLTGILWQTLQRQQCIRRSLLSIHDDAVQFGTRHKLERHGQILLNQLVHLSFNLPLHLPVGLPVKNITDLTLLSLYMSIS